MPLSFGGCSSTMSTMLDMPLLLILNHKVYDVDAARYMYFIAWSVCVYVPVVLFESGFPILLELTAAAVGTPAHVAQDS